MIIQLATKNISYFYGLLSKVPIAYRISENLYQKNGEGDHIDIIEKVECSELET